MAFVKDRYASWGRGLGKDIEKGNLGLKELEAYMLKKGEAEANTSGRPGAAGKSHQRIHMINLDPAEIWYVAASPAPATGEAVLERVASEFTQDRRRAECLQNSCHAESHLQAGAHHARPNLATLP